MLAFDHVERSFFGGVFGTHRTQAVHDLSFIIDRGDRVGLIGESGCGKSTLARMTANLIHPTGGQIYFEDKNLRKMNHQEKKTFRHNVQMIFQNPTQSFNPRMKLYDTIEEAVRVHHLADTKEKTEELILKNMETVGLTTDIFGRYPHEISGGQAQRLAILRILMIRPKLIIADEPTSMLDVSVQAQILNLLKSVMDETGASLLFISHDLEVVRAMCDRIMVMKDGQICEDTTTEKLFSEPQHPYSKFLIETLRHI